MRGFFAEATVSSMAKATTSASICRSSTQKRSFSNCDGPIIPIRLWYICTTASRSFEAAVAEAEGTDAGGGDGVSATPGEPTAEACPATDGSTGVRGEAVGSARLPERGSGDGAWGCEIGAGADDAAGGGGVGCMGAGLSAGRGGVAIGFRYPPAKAGKGG